MDILRGGGGFDPGSRCVMKTKCPRTGGTLLARYDADMGERGVKVFGGNARTVVECRWLAKWLMVVADKIRKEGK